MSDYDINKMDFKQLRNEVQLLRDELAIMQRKYEDLLYNLDEDNFSQRIVKQGNDMYTKIEQTAESITLQAEKVEENSKNLATLEITAEEISSEVFEEKSDGTKVSKITQNANAISAEVTSRQNDVSTLKSQIKQTDNEILAVISGEYTEDMLSNYLTGIEITPNNIKMISTKESYSIFSGNGLRFYDSDNQVEGWSIEPDYENGYGGVLNYYVNGNEDSDDFTPCYKFGSGQSGTGYTSTDMVIKAINGQRARFVVDVSKSAYPEVKFLVSDYSDSGDTPRIFANEQLLATQEWVLANGGGGTAVFA